METKRFEEILSLGETICIEFKRCGNGVESDVYETVCSFLNSFGGDIFLEWKIMNKLQIFRQRLS